MAVRIVLVLALLISYPTFAGAVTVTVPSSWTSAGWWVDTGLSVKAGDVIRVTASGSWSAWTPGGYYGPDGASHTGWDQWLNPNNLGNGAPDGSGVPPVIDHIGALIGFIGYSPLPISLYGNCDRDFRLLCVSKMVLLGSNVTVTAPATGKLYLGMNDDAYSGNASDNAGSITASVDIIRFNPSNGHYYQAVQVPAGIEWYNAAPAAERMSYNGAPGHLATITSADEASFINNNSPGADGYWLGGYQPVGISLPSAGWRWVTGEPWDYANWSAGKPDIDDGWTNGMFLSLPEATWQDDAMGRGRPGYIVEYDDWRPEPIENPVNGHFYQAVSVPSGLTWYQAEAAAAAMTYQGKAGHLVSITSASENAFVAALAPVSSGYWIGGYQPAGSPEPDQSWRWSTGEPWTYVNWDALEPNNSFGTDDGTDLRLNGRWNDRGRTDGSVSGYIVEFDAQPDYVLADNFDDNTTNRVIWTPDQSNGVTVEEKNGRLEMTFMPTASGSQFGGGYASTWKLRGDFDAQVDYELLTWPAGNGVRLALVPLWWSLQRGSHGPEISSLREQYTMDSHFGHGGYTTTADTQGTLRITRTGSVVSSYYLSYGQWKLLRSYDYGQNGLIDVPVLYLSGWSHDYAFADQKVKFALDNFILRKGQLIWNHPNTTSVGSVKSLADGSGVFIESAVVTADQTLDPGSVFIEAPNRSSGIRVVTSKPLTVGQNVRLNGIIRRVDGERLIDSTDFISIEPGETLSPIGVTSSTIGNDRNEILDYFGIDSTGLLVRMCGKVSAVVSSERVIYVEDGGIFQHGLGPYTGIRVHIPEGVSIPAKGKAVAVTGISRVEEHTLTQWGEVNGDWKPAGTVLYVPSVWLRDSEDLQVIR